MVTWIKNDLFSNQSQNEAGRIFLMAKLMECWEGYQLFLPYRAYLTLGAIQNRYAKGFASPLDSTESSHDIPQ